MRALRELTLILFAVAFALALSQTPGFVSAYEQRLGGALDEAQRTLSGFARDAAGAGFSFRDYVAHLRDSADASVAATGGTIQALSERVASLAAQQAELSDANKLKKPLLLAQHHDPELLRAAWQAYRASPSLDLEFGAIGLLLGWLVNAALWGLLGPRRAYA